MAESVFSRVRKAFMNWPSLISATFVACLLAFRVPWGLININAQNTSASIFQVSGTMVALIIPAAEISNAFISTLANDLLKVVYSQQVDASVQLKTVEDLTTELKDNLYPAWRGSVYALFAFILSSVGMIAPPVSIPLGGSGSSFSLDYFIVGASLGFLIVASFWFIPTARYAFQLELLDTIKAQAQHIFDNTPQPIVDQQSPKKKTQ